MQPDKVKDSKIDVILDMGIAKCQPDEVMKANPHKVYTIRYGFLCVWMSLALLLVYHEMYFAASIHVGFCLFALMCNLLEYFNAKQLTLSNSQLHVEQISKD